MAPNRRAAALAALSFILTLSCGPGPSGPGTGGSGATDGTPRGTPGYAISGKVQDASGAGVSGVVVTLSGPATLSATTDATGTYAFRGLSNGDYLVVPGAAVGYACSPTTLTVRVSGRDVTGRDFKAVRTGKHLSLGRPVHVSGGVASRCNDGNYGQDYWGIGTGVDNRWSTVSPAWCAIDLGDRGPTYVLVSLSDESAGANILGAPRFADYTVETSSDSTDGSDGSWTAVASITGNAHLYREHKVSFAGQRWIRVSITAPVTATLDELDVWDVSDAPPDSIVWVGDSITARCSHRSGGYGASPSFAAEVFSARPPHYPLQIGAGTVGVSSTSVLAGHPSKLDTYLALFPDVRYWGIALGTNDSNGNVTSATFQANLQTMVDRIVAAGHIPIIAHIPYTQDASYGQATARLNGIIDTVAASNGLVVGPDLYSLFEANVTDYYDVGVDSIHPNRAGCAAWQKAWADVIGPLL